MYSVLIFALISVASAQFVSKYPSTYGVNPVVHQTAVPHVGYNYGFANQKVVPYTYGMNNYGAHGYGGNYYTQPIHSYDANHYTQPIHTYAAPAHQYTANHYTAPIGYNRDFNIESTGEKYAYQNGPASFQYHFLKGADMPSHYTAPVVESHVVPHHARVSAAFPTVNNAYNGMYSSPLVKKFDTYSAKDLIAH